MLAGCQVTVHQHLDGTLSNTHGRHVLGRYTAQGATLATTKPPARRAVEKPHSPDDGYSTTKPDISLVAKTGHFNLLRT
jgi:hypothetical protein